MAKIIVRKVGMQAELVDSHNKILGKRPVVRIVHVCDTYKHADDFMRPAP